MKTKIKAIKLLSLIVLMLSLVSCGSESGDGGNSGSIINGFNNPSWGNNTVGSNCTTYLVNNGMAKTD